MGDKEVMPASAPCAIQKWSARKSLRYEVDDFIVSPPSNEDGGFFHLRFGRRPIRRHSAYDRVNKELSMTVEIKDGDPLISGVELLGASAQAGSSSPAVESSSAELSPSLTPEVELAASKSSSTKPLFVFHLRDSKGFGEPDKLKDSGEMSSSCNLSDNLASALNEISVKKSDSSESSHASVERLKGLSLENPSCEKGEVTQEKPQRRSVCKEQMPISNIGLVEKVQSLPVTPVELTPHTTPIASPGSSPNSKRKIYGVVMEQSSSHSYFCTKPFFSSQQTSESSQAFRSGVGGGEVGLSETSARMAQQLESGTRAALALEPGQKLAKKRRPKPSTLREMNFWAPTSM